MKYTRYSNKPLLSAGLTDKKASPSKIQQQTISYLFVIRNPKSETREACKLPIFHQMSVKFNGRLPHHCMRNLP